MTNEVLIVQSALVLVPATAAILMLFVAMFAFSGNVMPGRREFGIFASCVGIWVGLAALEYLSSSQTPRLFFGRALYVGAAFTPLAWLLFAARFTENDAWLTKKRLAALAIVPSTSLVLVALDHWLGLIWADVTFVEYPIPDLKITHGAWFKFVYVPYSYALFLLGLSLFASKFFTDLHRYRRQTIGLVIGASLVLLVNSSYLLADLTIYGVDPTPVAIALITLCLPFTLFQGFLSRPILSVSHSVHEHHRRGDFDLPGPQDRRL